MLPNFLIGGATRSGTTSLYFYLKQHPEISFPDLKEPRYFSSIDLRLPQNGPGDHTVDEKLVTSFDDYCELYKNLKNKRVGDASSEYLYHHDSSAKRVLSALGDIPIILILRNPIERAYSAYSNLIRDGREYLTFEEAIDKEIERRADNWDMMWSLIGVSMYYEQVKTYITTFTNVKVLIFEEFVSDIQGNLKEIFKFLEVDENFVPETNTVYSHSGKPTNIFLGWLTSRQNKVFYPLRKCILKYVPRKYLENISKLIFKKSGLEIKLKPNLISLIEEDIRCLEKLLNKSLDNWKNNLRDQTQEIISKK
ncbi:sulfotransferase [Akkermansiaceae bacterium]|nr:sulfotransferase [Akkermansiaceae bacterium]